MEMVGIQKGRMLEERRVLEEGGRRGGGSDQPPFPWYGK